MAQDTSDKYLKLLNSDEELQKKAFATKDWGSFAEIAKAKGHEFSEDEWKNTVRADLEANQKKSGELSDEDLAAVAGGTSVGACTGPTSYTCGYWCQREDYGY